MARAFFDACQRGDVDALERLLAEDPTLVQAAHTGADHGGWTGLHEAAKSGKVDAVRVLLRRGADPNAREAGDNTAPLHWAAARADVAIVRLLLDAGADVHATGDVHALDVIGWASFYHAPGGDPREVSDTRRASWPCSSTAARVITSSRRCRLATST